jgi:hypothetical protein
MKPDAIAARASHCPARPRRRDAPDLHENMYRMAILLFAL